MKNSLTLKEIDVAIKDPKYLKHQNHAKLIPIANEIIVGKFGKFEKADDSDNFKFPYYAMGVVCLKFIMQKTLIFKIAIAPVLDLF